MGNEKGAVNLTVIDKLSSKVTKLLKFKIEDILIINNDSMTGIYKNYTDKCIAEGKKSNNNVYIDIENVLTNKEVLLKAKKIDKEEDLILKSKSDGHEYIVFIYSEDI